ncbi:MAG: lytic murein transglycosylase [Gemmatimonadota bacterium]
MAARLRGNRPFLPRRLAFGALLAALTTGVAPGRPAGADAAFDTWLDQLRRDALERPVSPATLDAVLPRLEVLPRVLELQRRQPESHLTYRAYVARVAPPARLQYGRQQLGHYGDLLGRVSARYGVPPQVIVALWAVESDFGRHPGDLPVLSSLATLAYRGSRRAYFRSELLEALAIVDAGDALPDQMRGSWAGALGQCQFMPSNFRRLAVDWDGDGRRDIWGTPADVFASIAHFLSSQGWRADLTWGREVRLPSGFDYGLVGPQMRYPLSRWQALGVRRADGTDLPERDVSARLVLPDGKQGPAFLVYANYEALLRWNRSDNFALAAGHLADALR